MRSFLEWAIRHLVRQYEALEMDAEEPRSRDREPKLKPVSSPVRG